MKKNEMYSLIRRAAVSTTPDVWEKIEAADTPSLPVFNKNEERTGRAAHARKMPLPFKVASVALAAVVLSAGFLCIPTLLNGGTDTAAQSKKPVGISHSYELVACAASVQGEEGATPVVLKNNSNTVLPHGKIDVKAGDGGLNTSFTVKGDNVASVIYGSDSTGSGAKRVTFYNIDKSVNALVCTITLPTSQVSDDNVKGAAGVDGTAETKAAIEKNYSEDKTPMGKFKLLWKNGALDSYKAKYFAGKSTDLDDYIVSLQQNTDSKYTNFIIELKNKNTGDYSGDFSCAAGVLEGSTITVRESGAIVWWSPESDWFNKIEILSRQADPDYSTIGTCTVNIKVTFTDGQSSTEKVALSFDKIGNLCAKLEK